jgi:hypothetical protein
MTDKTTGQRTPITFQEQTQAGMKATDASGNTTTSVRMVLASFKAMHIGPHVIQWEYIHKERVAANNKASSASSTAAVAQTHTNGASQEDQIPNVILQGTISFDVVPGTPARLVASSHARWYAQNGTLWAQDFSVLSKFGIPVACPALQVAFVREGDGKLVRARCREVSVHDDDDDDGVDKNSGEERQSGALTRDANTASASSSNKGDGSHKQAHGSAHVRHSSLVSGALSNSIPVYRISIGDDAPRGTYVLQAQIPQRGGGAGGSKNNAAGTHAEKVGAAAAAGDDVGSSSSSAMMGASQTSGGDSRDVVVKGSSDAGSMATTPNTIRKTGFWHKLDCAGICLTVARSGDPREWTHADVVDFVHLHLKGLVHGPAAQKTDTNGSSLHHGGGGGVDWTKFAVTGNDLVKLTVDRLLVKLIPFALNTSEEEMVERVRLGCNNIKQKVDEMVIKSEQARFREESDQAAGGGACEGDVEDDDAAAAAAERGDQVDAMCDEPLSEQRQHADSSHAHDQGHRHADGDSADDSNAHGLRGERSLVQGDSSGAIKRKESDLQGVNDADADAGICRDVKNQEGADGRPRMRDDGEQHRVGDDDHQDRHDDASAKEKRCNVGSHGDETEPDDAEPECSASRPGSKETDSDKPGDERSGHGGSDQEMRDVQDEAGSVGGSKDVAQKGNGTDARGGGDGDAMDEDNRGTCGDTKGDDDTMNDDTASTKTTQGISAHEVMTPDGDEGATTCADDANILRGVWTDAAKNDQDTSCQRRGDVTNEEQSTFKGSGGSRSDGDANRARYGTQAAKGSPEHEQADSDDEDVIVMKKVDYVDLT